MNMVISSQNNLFDLITNYLYFHGTFSVDYIFHMCQKANPFGQKLILQKDVFNSIFSVDTTSVASVYN